MIPAHGIVILITKIFSIFVYCHQKELVMIRICIVFILSILLISCSGEKKPKFTGKKPPKKDPFAALYSQATKMFNPLPPEAVSEENPITDEKVLLGKMLYFDNRLSLNNTQSCNTCHNLDTYGVDNMPVSQGNNGGFGDRNSPTTLNAALHFTQFWDGREPHVEAQAGGPILNPVEMEMPDEKSVIERLKAIAEYQDLFSKAFPESNSPITYNNLKNAIGAFERRLMTPSRFDDYLNGDPNTLSIKEKQGLKKFLELGCGTCHAGALLGGDQFQKFGVHQNYWELTNSKEIDLGRFKVTNKEDDKYVFKVPSLRNIEKTAPYFHDGSIEKLEEAVKIMAISQLNKKISDSEAKQIVAFLNTLTGEVPEELKK